MTTNKKADNQWYGKGFEQAIVMIKKNNNYNNPYPDHIPNEDWLEIIENAKDFIFQYEKINPITSIEWIGNHTGTQDGDLIINGEKQEIKRVSQGLGTWGNFTIRHLYKYLPKNFPSHIEFMKKSGLYNRFQTVASTHKWESDLYATNFLTKEDAKKFGDNFVEEDENWRRDFVKAVYDAFLNNPESLQAFINDCITKKISPRKNMPKNLIIYNYKTKKISNFADTDIIKKEYDASIKMNEFGVVLDTIRVNFSWKNHCGNNLAMYIFLR